MFAKAPDIEMDHRELYRFVCKRTKAILNKVFAFLCHRVNFSKYGASLMTKFAFAIMMFELRILNEFWSLESKFGRHYVVAYLES